MEARDGANNGRELHRSRSPRPQKPQCISRLGSGQTGSRQSVTAACRAACDKRLLGGRSRGATPSDFSEPRDGGWVVPKAKRPQVSETVPSARLWEFLKANPRNDYCALTSRSHSHLSARRKAARQLALARAPCTLGPRCAHLGTCLQPEAVGRPARRGDVPGFEHRGQRWCTGPCRRTACGPRNGGRPGAARQYAGIKADKGGVFLPGAYRLLIMTFKAHNPAKAQSEPMVQPNGMADHFGWKAVASIRGSHRSIATQRR